ncbi:MAG: ABC transporter permease [Anaerolineae bacterium]|nr:ABC transporter permease [Anaerolineae bacterium]
MSTDPAVPATNPPLRSKSPIRLISNFLYRHSCLATALLLLLPMLWLVVIYLGSLGTMMLQSFYTYNRNTAQIIEEFSLEAYKEAFTDPNLSPPNKDAIKRTVRMAAAVTIAAAILAFPLAYYMARYAGPKMKGALYLGVMLPLWSSYLVRVYAWKLILAKDGVMTWFLEKLGLMPVLDWLLDIEGIGGNSLSTSYIGVFLVFLYVWMPYMVLPINAALERVPKSLTEASSDLGARPWYTFLRVILPLSFPGVVAGSIFTFSLTLGDYIIPSVIGTSSYFLGTLVFTHRGTVGNWPLAAVLTLVPVVIMMVYLSVAKRLGAFDAL